MWELLDSVVDKEADMVVEDRDSLEEVVVEDHNSEMEIRIKSIR